MIDEYPPDGKRHPYYPRDPHARWWNDTEPAYSVAPWEGCCDKDDSCECVSPEDVAKWNAGYSAAATLSGVDWDKISSYSAIAASADLWNDDYLTTSENSAYWNSVSGLSGVSATLSDNSANWNGTYNTVFKNSAYWNKAVNYSGQIGANYSAISALSAAFGKQIKLYFDPNTIQGDGTTGAPYTVKNYEEFIALLNKAFEGYQRLYTPEGSAKWMSVSSTTDDPQGINPYLKTLFNAINKKDNDQDITLNNHGDLIQWILKHLNPPPPITGTDLNWVQLREETPEYIRTCTTPNTIYFSGYTV
jgi:hypothetical protein